VTEQQTEIPLTNVEQDEQLHSGIMGGSNAEQRLNCPGSYKLEKQMPKGPPSEYAVQGSVFHAAMELLLTADPETDDELEGLLDELVGQDLGFGEEWKITAEQINVKVRPAWESWITIRDEHGIDDWFIEQRVSLDKVIPRAFGTVDILGKDVHNGLHVLDWKFGDGVSVPVEGNSQLTFYAAGALYDDDPELAAFCDEVSVVHLHIVQPRVGANRVYESWQTDEAYIEKFLDLAVAAVAAAATPEPPIKPGTHCRWCDGKPICPAHEAAGIEALAVKPESMTATDLATNLNRAALLKTWISAVFDLAQRELEGGAQIPGWKLVPKQPRRQWIDAEAAEAMLKKRKVKIDVMYERKLRSPTQIEKLKPDLYSRVLSANVEARSSGLTVVDDSDPREAVADHMALLTNALQESGNATDEEIGK
jgi:hypothetical protein